MAGEFMKNSKDRKIQPDKINEAYEMMGETFPEHRDSSHKFEYRNMEQAMGQVMFGGSSGYNW
jgi:hypothetical protein